jgi:hypothetical protein
MRLASSIAFDRGQIFGGHGAAYNAAGAWCQTSARAWCQTSARRGDIALPIRFQRLRQDTGAFARSRAAPLRPRHTRQRAAVGPFDVKR